MGPSPETTRSTGTICSCTEYQSPQSELGQGGRGEARAVLAAGSRLIRAQRGLPAARGRSFWLQVTGRPEARQTGRRMLRREAWPPGLLWGRDRACSRVRWYGGSCGGGELPVAEGCPGQDLLPRRGWSREWDAARLPSAPRPCLSAFFSAQRSVLCDHGWGPALSGPPTGLSLHHILSCCPLFPSY